MATRAGKVEHDGSFACRGWGDPPHPCASPHMAHGGDGRCGRCYQLQRRDQEVRRLTERTREMAIEFVVFDQPARLRNSLVERISIRRDRRLYLSRPAFDALGKPHAVELVFARYGTLVGVRPCDPALPHARRIVGKRDRSGGQVSLPIGDFLAFHGIKVELPVGAAPRKQGDIIFISLSKGE